MKMRMDMLDDESMPGIEVVQLTTEEGVPASHIYMEAQIFTPDSRRLVLHRSSHAHGSDQYDPEHRYLLCDLEDNCRLQTLTSEAGATAPSLSPDGDYLYYLVNQTRPGAGRLVLKRVRLDGTERQTLLVLDTALPGTRYRPSRMYPLSTISSDGRRLATCAFLGDGNRSGAPWGLLVFDLERPAVNLALVGQTWCNMHPQYSRSPEAEAAHDILVQENHGNICDACGVARRGVAGAGADIHVIRDDGANFRDMPWGRDGNEFCQGHQCWRGRSSWAITSTGIQQPREQQLIEGLATAASGHLGTGAPGAVRNDLSRDFPQPALCHFATDRDGRRLVTDAGPFDDGGGVFIAEFGQAGEDALTNWRRLLNPRRRGQKAAHVHPFLSPDGRTAFFNSDESGLLQAYMVRGLPPTEGHSPAPAR